MATPDTADLDAFGLKRPPFSGPVDASATFWSDGFAAAHRDLMRTLGRGEPLVVLSGPSGTGKTLLWRAVVDALEPARLSAIVDPFLSETDLLQQIATDFQAVPKEEVDAETIVFYTTHALLMHVRDAVAALAPQGKRALVVIDDAHHAQRSVLAQVRALLNVGAESSNVQVLLVGGPELEERLAHPDLAAVSERVTGWARISAFSPEEVEQYIEQRLTAAGRSKRGLFDAAASDHIAAASGGIARAIDQIANAALASAYQRGGDRVTGADVAGAVPPILAAPLPEPPPRSPRGVFAAVAGLSLLTLIVAAAVLVPRFTAQSDDASYPSPQPQSTPDPVPPPAAVTPSAPVRESTLSPGPSGTAAPTDSPASPSIGRSAPSPAAPAAVRTPSRAAASSPDISRVTETVPPRGDRAAAAALTQDMSDAEAIRRGKAFASKGDVRGLLGLQDQIKKTRADQPETAVDILLQLDRLVEEARLQRLKLDSEALRKPGR